MYPILLHLDGRRCLVVGGGEVAVRKVLALVAEGAHVTVVAPRMDDRLTARADGVALTVVARPYASGEAAAGYTLVIAATADRALNEAVADDARRGGALVNVVDTPDLCDFYVPAVVRRGDLVLAISTSGAFPALSRRLRRDLEPDYPAAWARLLTRLRVFREELLAREPDAARRAAWVQRVAADPALAEFLAGNETPLEELLQSCE